VSSNTGIVAVCQKSPEVLMTILIFKMDFNYYWR